MLEVLDVDLVNSAPLYSIISCSEHPSTMKTCQLQFLAVCFMHQVVFLLVGSPGRSSLLEWGS